MRAELDTHPLLDRGSWRSAAHPVFGLLGHRIAARRLRRPTIARAQHSAPCPPRQGHHRRQLRDAQYEPVDSLKLRRPISLESIQNSQSPICMYDSHCIQPRHCGGSTRARQCTHGSIRLVSRACLATGTAGDQTGVSRVQSRAGCHSRAAANSDPSQGCGFDWATWCVHARPTRW